MECACVVCETLGQFLKIHNISVLTESASSKGSGKSSHMHRFVITIVCRIHKVFSMGCTVIRSMCTYAINAKVSCALALYIQAGKTNVVIKALKQNLSQQEKMKKEERLYCELKNKSVNN